MEVTCRLFLLLSVPNLSCFPEWTRYLSSARLWGYLVFAALCLHVKSHQKRRSITEAGSLYVVLFLLLNLLPDKHYIWSFLSVCKSADTITSTQSFRCKKKVWLYSEEQPDISENIGLKTRETVQPVKKQDDLLANWLKNASVWSNCYNKPGFELFYLLLVTMAVSLFMVQVK